MNAASASDATGAGGIISSRAWDAMREIDRGPAMLEDWARILFIHYEVDPAALQPQIPYELDTFDGRAFVSLTAFHGHGLRPAFSGAAGRFFFRPAQFPFIMNVRTYVRHENEAGIYFLAEWIPNRIAAFCGRQVFGLPFHTGRLAYRHEENRAIGEIEDSHGEGRFAYEAEWPQEAQFATAESGSRTEWLLERYAAFTKQGSRRRFFRVWHPAWPQTEASVRIREDSLLRNTGPWFDSAQLIGANYSPGFFDVHMGRAWRLSDEEKVWASLPAHGTKG